MTSPTRCARTAIAIAIAAALTLPATRAPAATPEESALAEALFREAKTLMAAGRFAEACPKLVESQRLDPGGGTILTLATCHEGEGKTASAWSEYAEALAVARREGRTNREAIAQERIELLGPRLMRLRVRVADAALRTPGLVVRRDSVELGPAAWDLASPVDPGEHRVEAHAPGFVPFRVEVLTTQEGGIAVVEIGELTPEVAPKATPPTAPAPAAHVAPPPRADAAPRAAGAGPLPRWPAFAIGGLGLAAVGAGGYFALDARSKQDDANARCPGTACADPTAVAANQDAGRAADVATGAFIAGGVLVAAGVAWWLLTAPSGPSASASPALVRF